MTVDLPTLIAAATTIGPLAILALAVILKLKNIEFGGFKITFRDDK